MNKKFSIGFTLIELLVVIAIMGILSGAIMLSSLKGLSQARDARRVQEVFQVASSLTMFYTTYGYYPTTTDTNDSCDFYGVPWDRGNAIDASDEFIKSLEIENFMTPTPKEWRSNMPGCTYRYAKVNNPCDGQCVGNYAILYAVCETDKCPINERADCCDGSSWVEGAGNADKYDITIFLKER